MIPDGTTAEQGEREREDEGERMREQDVERERETALGLTIE